MPHSYFLSHPTCPTWSVRMISTAVRSLPYKLQSEKWPRITWKSSRDSPPHRTFKITLGFPQHHLNHNSALRYHLVDCFSCPIPIILWSWGRTLVCQLTDCSSNPNTLPIPIVFTSQLTVSVVLDIPKFTVRELHYTVLLLLLTLTHTHTNAVSHFLSLERHTSRLYIIRLATATLRIYLSYFASSQIVHGSGASVLPL